VAFRDHHHPRTVPAFRGSSRIMSSRIETCAMTRAARFGTAWRQPLRRYRMGPVTRRLASRRPTYTSAVQAAGPIAYRLRESGTGRG
jgi:hypothetical protein